MSTSEIIVVKFGGSVLENDETIAKAAAIVGDAVRRGLGVVVVVSALKGVTDNLLGLSRKVNPNINPSMLDDLLAIGERTSARLFAAALGAKGFDAEVIDPDSESWPILTDGNHLDANPLLDQSRERAQKLIIPLIRRGKIPVVCGFIGKTVEGKITTLGRGGSDTTAVILGQCLGAKEVVLIKDTQGVFSSDPDKVADAHRVETLNGAEAELLASGGAKFLHPKALRYNTNGLRIRITGLERLDSGTVIEGELPDLSAEVAQEQVTMITIIGVDTSDIELVGQLSHALRDAGASLLALSLESNSVLLYVAKGSNILNAVHQVLLSKGIGKAVSSFEGLSMITVYGRALETTPGLIQRVTQPLARAKINLFGIVTISSSIKVFVQSSHVKNALEMLRSALLMTPESEER